MAYSTNPNLPKARAIAMRLLVADQLPVLVVARKCGVSRTTIWRWRRKWDVINKDIQLTNDNRPNREQPAPSSRFRLAAVTWRIPTTSSRPHTSPSSVSAELVELVLSVRAQLKRCAEVVWHHLTTKLGVIVSLSSVRRILWRAGVTRGRKPRVKRDNPRRPMPTTPGELVQTDTIHHVDPCSGRKLYYYTVIDLYTRMTYAACLPRLGAGLAARVVLEAQQAFGFSFSMVQSDNGPEFSRFFEQRLRGSKGNDNGDGNGIAVRHSRLGRTGCAHIERFNRTIQTECIGYYWRRSVPLPRQQAKLTAWLAYYNDERVHLGIQMRTPCEMLQRF